MIRVNITGYPIVYQNDNTYQMPNITGAVQWNGTTKRFEVSTGYNWQPIDNNITLNTSPHLMSCIQWVEKKIIEEQELEKLASQSPIVKNLLDQIQEKQNQLLMVKNLIK